MRLRLHHGLAALLFLAVVLRFAATATTYLSFYHPDELFQYLEQAHRLDFGYGVVPWEYRYGMRSWLLPLLLASPMRLGDLLDPAGDLHLLLPKALMALSSLGVVWGAYILGRRFSPLHALLAGFVAAVWFDFVLFAAHGLSESASFTAFVIAAALALGEPRKSSTLVAAGMLFGIAAILRIQYLPAIGVFALTRRLELRYWPHLLGGGLAALAASALIDLSMSQTPFAWLIENIRQNLLNGRSDGFGTAPPLAYLGEMGLQWSFWLAAILPLVGLGARRYPTLFWAAVANLAVHMAIPHKEYRFILLTTGLLILLAAIGTGDAITAAQRRWPSTPHATWVGAALSLWTVASAICAFSGNIEGRWRPNAPMMEVMDDARRLPDLCGIGVYRIRFWQGSSYTVLHRAVPMYDIPPPAVSGESFDTAAALTAILPAVNALVATPDALPDIPPTYRLAGCHATNPADKSREVAEACLFVRSGACAPLGEQLAAFEINQLLRRIDE